jgi:ribosomal protein S18 acetylase RimI-like enzyme
VTAEVELRAAGPGDLEFLYALLEVALGPYVAQTYGAWKEEEQRARFAASTRPESHQIVELAGRPVGCLAVDWSGDHVKLQRVLLVPEAQGRGIGSHLVRELLARASAARRPVRLRVFKVNPAQRLWRRLGFTVIGETETHWLMEHAP